MFAYLTGIVIHKDPTSVVLDVNGIGYQISIPLSTYERLPGINQSTKLLIHFQVREDAQTLYGFHTEEEKNLFLNLINISGIGPKMAITILSGATPAQFKNRIIAGDVNALTLIPGIGMKTAKRIIVELREKLVGADDTVPGDFGVIVDSKYSDEALKALLSLGYRRTEALNAIKRALKELDADTSVEKILKVALNKM
jgi:Holliday junction DNA helicase RuvA